MRDFSSQTNATRRVAAFTSRYNGAITDHVRRDVIEPVYVLVPSSSEQSRRSYVTVVVCEPKTRS
jgi:hypothetical protein